MSRTRARDPREIRALATAVVTALAPRRLAIAALAITAAAVAAAPPATARVAPHHPRADHTALRSPGPGSHGGGGQVVKGGHGTASQHASGAGRYNQNLTGVTAPGFVKGQAQQAITDHGSFEVQSAFCAWQPDECLIGQNMPVRRKS